MFPTKCKCSVANTSSPSIQKTFHRDGSSLTWQKRTSHETRQGRISYWAHKPNVLKFMTWIASQLQIQSTEDWYRVTTAQITEKGGGSLLRRFGTFKNLLQFVFPEVNWDPSKFLYHRAGFWTRDNILQYVESLKPKLNIQNHEDWYKVGVEQLLAVGGQGFMRKYKSSVYNLLKDIYPEYDWQPWRFPSAPRHFWKSKSGAAQYVKWLENELGINSLRDWTSVSAQDIDRHYGGATLLRTYGGLQAFLRSFYPDHDWDAYQTGKESTISKAQQRLTHVLRRIFPETDMVSNYRHKEMASQEFDIFIPQFNLAFEYQGEQHYSYHFIYNTDNIVQSRDAKKFVKAKELNIDLIHIPYWWDRSEQSLRATIQSARPDLGLSVDPAAKPIAAFPPKSSRSIAKEFPFLQLMEASPDHCFTIRDVMESTGNFPPQDIQGWWAYQVEDGTPVYWNCEARKFYDKYGNILQADSQLVAAMPDIPLEGFLLNRSSDGPKFLATDLPNSTTTYRDRHQLLQQIFPQGSNKYGDVVGVVVCKDIQHLKEYLQGVPPEAQVVLKNPMSHYHPGRTAFNIITISNHEEQLVKVEQVITENGHQVTLCRLSDKSQIKVVVPNSIKEHRLLRVSINKFQATFLSTVDNMSWETYLRTVYPYELSVGKAAAKCRGCHKSLPREDYRITTHQAQYSSSQALQLYNSPIPISQYPYKKLPAHFCVSSACIRTAMARNQSPTISTVANTTQQPQGRVKAILFPCFGDTVYLPQEIRSTMNEDQLKKFSDEGKFSWVQ